MTSELHLEALAWLRYGKRLPLLCTEVGAFNADILALNGDYSLEVEIKRSKADLLRDFTKPKHFLYNSGSTSAFVPNYFYYLVPQSLADKAKEIIKEKAPKAGLAVVSEDVAKKLGERIRVAIRPTKIHDSKPTMRLIQTALMRMSSELVGLHNLNHKAGESIVTQIKKTIQDVAISGMLLHGVLDAEKAAPDLELRAMELAMCVDGLDKAQWDSLNKTQKNKWFQAFEKWSEAQCAKPEWPATWYR